MKILIISTLALTLIACKVADLIEGEFVDYAEPPAETYSKADDPARVLPPNPAACPDWEADTTVQITESTMLPEGCMYDRVSVEIVNQSDLVFDCNGGILNGLNKEFRQEIDTSYKVGEEPVLVGILVQSSENFQSRNVTIKNCIVTNYVRGIRINMAISAASRDDLKNNVNVEALESNLRSISPKNIRIEDSNISFSHKDGVFVGRFITDFVMDNSTVNSTGAVGVYIDSGSGDNTISNSTLSKNGYSDYDITNREIKKKNSLYSREALAIDSSFGNKIEGNEFSLNSRGSVFIYKNCNEHYQDPNQIPRYQSADNNLISNNTFTNEDYAVWVASRQSSDLKDLECEPPIIATGTISYGPVDEDTEYYEDFAKNNQVLNNQFTNVNSGVKVEDDNTIVQGNIFSGTGFSNVTVGTKYRTEVLGRPVMNTLIDANEFISEAPNKIDLIFNPIDTVITNNTPAELND